MSRVIGTQVIEKKGYRFKSGMFGKQILQVGSLCQDWDTNSGQNDGPQYVSWNNADRYEAEEFLKLAKE